MYLNPAEVSAVDVQAAVDRIGLFDGMYDVRVLQVGAENYPEDWGDFSVIVDIFGSDASAMAPRYAKRLAAELRATVLAEPQLNEHMVEFRARAATAAS